MRVRAAITLAWLSLTAACGPSQAEYDAAQAEIRQLRAEVADLRNTPVQRLAHIRELMAKDSSTVAEREIAELTSRFPATSEARIARAMADSLARGREAANREKQAREAEAERQRRLGFRALADHETVRMNDLIVRASIRRAHRWIMDNTEDVGEYHYRDAERGSDFVLADLSITAESKDPSLPPILVYTVTGDHLSLAGSMEYEFKRWRSYGGYLGNYTDYTNDFAHTSTIPFTAGVELPSNVFSGPLVILAGNSACVSRNFEQFGTPRISYRASGCSTPASLTIDDVRAGYTVLRVLNRPKL
jgi:hypothetical protein